MAEKTRRERGGSRKLRWGKGRRGTSPDTVSEGPVRDHHDSTPVVMRVTDSALTLGLGGSCASMRATWRSSVPNGSNPGPTEVAAGICRSLVRLTRRSSSRQVILYTSNHITIIE